MAGQIDSVREKKKKMWVWYIYHFTINLPVLSLKIINIGETGIWKPHGLMIFILGGGGDICVTCIVQLFSDWEPTSNVCENGEINSS